MLVLTRKPGESIDIGGNVVIRVVEVRGGRVKIGIEAPKNMTVNRSEVSGKIALQAETARVLEP